MSDKNMKLISIIVPIYNVEKYLDRCVQSIFVQTYENYELILVDDGSSDGCGKMCEYYAVKDRRVKVIHKENGGLSDARNAGLEIAQGAYVAFVDSDDWLSPHYLEYLYEVEEKTTSDIVECEVIRTSNEVEILEANLKCDIKSYGTSKALEYLIEDQVFHQYVWNKLYKREVINNILFERGKINEDEFWTYQIFGNAQKITKIDSPLYYYFQRETSIMGVEYNIKRLDALEAKNIRQEYIQKKFPQLASFAKLNLLQSCIYAGQMTLIYLDGDDQEEAKKKINRISKNCKLTIRELKKKSNMWLFLSKISFWGTCQLKNRLKRGF